MQEFVYSAEMRGTGTPVDGKEGVIGAETTGKGPGGEDIGFVSEVVMSDDGFTETGTITYPGRGSVNFDTAGIGQLGPSPVEGVMHGSVMWNVTGGDGEFSGATGRITSNFTFTESGEVVDNQYVRIYTA